MNWTGGTLPKFKRKLNKKDQERARIENYIKKRQYEKMKQKIIFPSLNSSSLASDVAQHSSNSSDENVMTPILDSTTCSTRTEEDNYAQFPSSSKYFEASQFGSQILPSSIKRKTLIKTATACSTTTIVDSGKKIYRQINQQITWNFDADEEEEQCVTFEPEAIDEIFQN